MTQPIDFLQLAGKTFLVFGVANRKSVAYAIGRTLERSGATRGLRRAQRRSSRDSVAKLLAGRAISSSATWSGEEEIAASADERRRSGASTFHGLVHSIAFADYDGEVKPFHETGKSQFLRAVDISCYSLMALCQRVPGPASIRTPRS